MTKWTAPHNYDNSLDHQKLRVNKPLGVGKEGKKKKWNNKNQINHKTQTVQNLELKVIFYFSFHQDLKVLYQSLCWPRKDHSGWSSYALLLYLSTKQFISSTNFLSVLNLNLLMFIIYYKIQYEYHFLSYYTKCCKRWTAKYYRKNISEIVLTLIPLPLRR